MIEFNPSEPLTLGAELELQLLDGETHNLADGILPLLELYPHSQYVKPEFLQNTVEIASKVCHGIAELEAHMRQVAADLALNCERLAMTLCGAGTHPFARHVGVITPFPRYLRIGKDYGYLSLTQITFGTHVHVGMTSGNELISTMRRLKPYLPLLVALSASSPFFDGCDSGFASYRHRVLAATRSYGIPPSFASWEAFSEFFESVSHAGMFTGMNDIHWDIRPRPHLGTLEVRAMDAQATVAEAIDLAALVLILVVLLTRSPDRTTSLPRQLPWWIEKENHFQASRRGMEAVYVANARGSVMPLRELWRQVAAVLRPTARELGLEDRLDRLGRRVAGDGLGYARQRAVHHETGSFEAVTRSLADELSLENRPAGVRARGESS